MIRRLRIALLLLLTSIPGAPARAHIGSKDVFEQVQAGPYRLYVTLRPPVVVPGAVGVEVRVAGGDISSLGVSALPLTGVPSRLPPQAQPMQRDATDRAFYTGAVWVMAAGSWQVRFVVHGAQGDAEASVPVPSAPLYVRTMGCGLGWLLALLGALLVLGLLAIVYAAVRDASVPPGVAPLSQRTKLARTAAACTLLVLVAALYAGNRWWNLEAASTARDLYHPLVLVAALHGDTLELTLTPGASDPTHRPLTQHDLLLDHGHLMHLYAIRWPGMDAAFHLHPSFVRGWTLSENLPAMPPGTYRLFADVVHANGFPETLTTTLAIPPGLTPAPLSPEDAASQPPPLRAGKLGSDFRLPDGYTMHWDRPQTLTVSQPAIFRFVLRDAQGNLATDVHPYLGMAGHAAFVKSDGSVFVHTHPEGTVAMPAMKLAEGDSMAMPSNDGDVIPAVVEFPFGVPSPGRYRIFVQIKHSSTVETGVFDLELTGSR